ncbi:hypothetical protein HA466_0163200 [Hirschfeldia incana]|nr:hypothetical protein HA466_0163200 [Hirschfeldia incana]
MAPKSAEMAHFLNLQRWRLFLSISRTFKPSGGRCRDRDCVTVKKQRSDHKDRDPQGMPATTYLQQQANNVCALAGVKIESSTVEKAPLASNDSVSASAGAVSGAPLCADASDMLKLREYMRKLVLNTLQQYKPCPADDASRTKYMTVARRLEQMLYKMAISKEDYMNQSTLESRIASLVKGKRLNNYDKRHANSSSVGRMELVPTTTGLSHAGGNPSSMVTSSACASSVGIGPSPNHDVLELREYMRTLVYSELHKHHPCPDDNVSKTKYLDVARRLEEGLLQMSTTKEDYLNPSTLTSRLASLMRSKMKKLNNCSKIQQNADSSSPGTMTTLAPEVLAETTMVLVSLKVREKVPKSEDQLETEIAENLKSMSLYI